MLRPEENSPYQYLERVIPVFRFDFRYWPKCPADAGVVDEAVKAAKGVDGTIDRGNDFVFLRDVCLDETKVRWAADAGREGLT